MQTREHGSSFYCQHDLGWAVCLGRTFTQRMAHTGDPATGKPWRGLHPGRPPLKTAPLGVRGGVAAAPEHLLCLLWAGLLSDDLTLPSSEIMTSERAQKSCCLGAPEAGSIRHQFWEHEPFK